MRPVIKYNVGDSVVLNDVTTHVISEDYNPYQSAKPVLIANLGQYCSYCECGYYYARDLAVEHVQPKGLDQYKPLHTKWTNFLLSCDTCNGSDNKGAKDVVLDEVHLPHRNNTFLSLTYLPGGVVTVNPKLTGESRAHAENLWRLVGFDKTPKQARSGDTRWRKRLEDWNIAEEFLLKYNAGQVTKEVVLQIAQCRGGWSIWFTVFKGVDEVRKALIDQFSGTAAECFDAANHYEPILRNLGQADPV